MPTHPTRTRAMALFALRFGLLFVASQLILVFVNVVPLQIMLASIVATTLNVPVNGIYLPLTERVYFEISAFCTGLTSVAMLAGLLFGFNLPSLREKILYSVMGGLIILAGNVLRLLLIVYVGHLTHDPGIAETMHTLTWFGMSALVLGIWYWGMMRLTKSKSGNELARKLVEI